MNKKLMTLSPWGLLLIICVLSCNQTASKTKYQEAIKDLDTVKIAKSNSGTTKQKVEDSVSNETFNQFYERFINDLKFQDSRIKYPLKGEYYNSQMGDVDDITYIWTREDSLQYSMSKEDSSIYKVDRKVSDSLVIEKIYIENSGFQITTHFKLTNSKWYMVYFSFINV